MEYCNNFLSEELVNKKTIQEVEEPTSSINDAKLTNRKLPMHASGYLFFMLFGECAEVFFKFSESSLFLSWYLGKSSIQRNGSTTVF